MCRVSFGLAAWAVTLGSQDNFGTGPDAGQLLCPGVSPLIMKNNQRPASETDIVSQCDRVASHVQRQAPTVQPHIDIMPKDRVLSTA